ncbi:MAG TPA: NUDIX domain-containing protein [Candidatus Magasanikbacteria bacterium]|nr:NUDIX domain-containing protein [Candidatus Magasanikbacteria bacterium]
MSTNYDNYQISLKLILQNKENKFLLLKVEDGGGYHGYYDFPGGRINEEEFTVGLSEILKRETSEEIGTTIKYELISKTPIAYGRHKWFSKRQNKLANCFYLVFEGKLLEGDVKISNEHASYVWMSYEDIKNNLETLFVSGILECAKMYFK